MPPADPNSPNRLSSNAYALVIRQEPQRAKVAGQGKEKDRKPIDPPPIIQLKIKDPHDPAQNYLQSPYYFVAANLWHATEDHSIKCDDNTCALSGTIVSSLHRLKDTDNADGGYFVFGDVSVRLEGEFRLQFILFEMLQGEVVVLKSILTSVFTVFSAKNFPGMSESTFLSRSFGDQGVRLRIRKETRALKRPASSGPGSGELQQYQQPRQDTTNPRGQINYQHSPAFMQQSPRNYPQEYQESISKRQRSAGPSDKTLYHRPQPPNGWTLPQTQTTDSLHSLQNQQPVPGYNQDGSSVPQMDFQFRSSNDGSMIQQSFLGRPQISDYGSGQQEGSYDAASRYAPHETSAGQYGDRLNQPLSIGRHPGTADYDLVSTLPNQDQQSVISSGQSRNIAIRDDKYPQYPLQSGDRNMRSSFPHYNQASQHTLPPLPQSTAATSSQPVLPSSPAYNNFGSSDGRYASQAPPQPGMQGSRNYSGYSAGT